MNRHQYTLYEAKIFAKFPGKTKSFSSFLRRKGYIINKHRAHGAYIIQGWFEHLEKTITTKNGRQKKVTELVVTERGIGFLQWLVANHIDEIRGKRKLSKKRNKINQHGNNQQSNSTVRGTGPSTELPN
jgi:hypothetical protein